jgi:hypothetical protein
MPLLHRHQTRPKDSATIPFCSLALPRWAAVQGTESRLVRARGPVKWTCARCGVVVRGMSAAAHHIELHRSQERPLP